MAIKTYSELINQLADNSTRQISPQDVREIIETLATRYIVATYDPGSSIGPTGAGTWYTMPLNKFGTGGSPDMTASSGVITIGTPGLYTCNYRMTGNFTSGGVPRMKLRFNPTTTPVDLPFSTVSCEVTGNETFTLSGSYLLNIVSPLTTIDLQYSTVSSETWQSPQGFLVVTAHSVRQT